MSVQRYVKPGLAAVHAATETLSTPTPARLIRARIPIIGQNLGYRIVDALRDAGLRHHLTTLTWLNAIACIW